MAAKAQVEFVGIDAGLERHVDEVKDQLADIGAGSDPNLLTTPGGFLLNKAYEMFVDGLNHVADQIQDAVMRNENFARAFEDLNDAYEGMWDSFVEGFEIFIPVLEKAVDLIEKFTPAMGQLGAAIAAFFDKLWETPLVKLIVKGIQLATPDATGALLGGAYNWLDSQSPNIKPTTGVEEALKERARWDALTPEQQAEELAKAIAKESLNPNWGRDIENYERRMEREAEKEERRLEKEERQKFRDDARMMEQMQKLNEDAEKFRDKQLEKSELAAADANIEALRDQKRRLRDNEPDAFRSQFLSGQDFWRKIQTDAASDNQREIKEATKRSADALDEMIKEGIKLKDDIKARFA